MRKIDVLETNVDEKYYLNEERTTQLLKEFPRKLTDGVDGFNKATGGVSYALTTRTASCYLPHHVRTSQATLISVKGLPIREATKKGYSEANEGDAVNYQYPDSETRRGRVGKQLANTLEVSGVNQGVVVRKVYSLEDLEERFMNESDLLKQGEIKQIIFDEFGVNRKCNRCTNQVLISDIKGYPYLCFECDENLFEFETYKDIEMVIGSTQKNAAITDGDISPTLTSSMGTGGGHVPMAVYKDTEKIVQPKEEQDVVLGVGHHPFSKKREFNGYGDLSPTLIATDYKAPKTALMSDLRIRKLSPLETWRLQGFTDEQFYKAKNDGVSNSQLYKQAGNSVTVNVIDAIARKLT